MSRCPSSIHAQEKVNWKHGVQKGEEGLAAVLSLVWIVLSCYERVGLVMRVARVCINMSKDKKVKIV